MPSQKGLPTLPAYCKYQSLGALLYQHFASDTQVKVEPFAMGLYQHWANDKGIMIECFAGWSTVRQELGLGIWSFVVAQKL